MDKEIIRLVDEVYPQMVEWRRHFHRFPELSGREKKTAQMIYDELWSFGVDEVQYMSGNTAVVGLIRGKNPERKCLAIRADIDALPVTEQTGLPFSSENEGVMHACGHDGHAAILLGTAKVLCGMRDRLNGSVKLIFEPHEERIPGGAMAMLDQGVMENPHVDALIGLHIVPHEKCGVVAAKPGVISIGGAAITVEITGKGGHAATPHLSNDVVLAGAEYVVAVQQIVSRCIAPKDVGIVTVGCFEAGVGTAGNVMPDKAVLKVNARSYDLAVGELLKRKLYEIAEGMEKISGCKFSLDYQYIYQPVNNDPDCVELIRKACTEDAGAEFDTENGELFGGEDVSVFMNETNTPGAFFMLLSGCEGDTVYPNHHPQFTWKEEAMAVGAKTFVSAAVRFLAE